MHETDTALRADIEDEFRRFDPDIGIAVYRLYQAVWILREKLPDMSVLPALAIDQIREVAAGAMEHKREALPLTSSESVAGSTQEQSHQLAA